MFTAETYLNGMPGSLRDDWGQDLTSAPFTVVERGIYTHIFDLGFRLLMVTKFTLTAEPPSSLDPGPVSWFKAP